MVGSGALDRQASPSYDQCLVEAELRARAAYAQPGRHYHDERHLDECLAQLDEMVGLDERERRLLRWAILWHDVVYEPGRFDNEERSARRAEWELGACGVDQPDASEVGWLIRLTEKHNVPEGARLGALLVSIDLSVLGSDSERYRSYVEGVRREYAHVPDAMWKAGRAEVLKRLLARDPIYPDPQFRARFEDQARRNMKEELRALAEG